MLFAVEIHVLVAVVFGVVALLLALTMLGIWSMGRRDEPPRPLAKTAGPSHGQEIPARRLPETQTSTDERSMADSDSDVAIVVNQATPDLATSFLDGELAAEDETIETVDLHDVISEDDEELAELRLTLDASQTELTHLTASRDQALTIVANHDQLIEQLRQRAVDQDAENESLQQQNQSFVAQVADIEQKSASLETELAQTRAELEAASQQLAQHEHAANESIPQNEAQQQATIDEFRVVLGQHEAAQASLERENLDLTTQLSDWQQKVNDLETELQSLREKLTTAGEPMSPAISDAQIEQELTALHAAQRRAASDLSFADETVKQLNQELMQRDALVAQLNGEKHCFAQQAADLQQQLDNAQRDAAANSDIVTERDQARSDLENLREQWQGTHDAAEQQANALSELQTEYQALQTAHEQRTTELEEATAQLRSSQDEQIELKQELVCLKDASEAWTVERGGLLQRLAGLDEEPSSDDGVHDSPTQLEELHAHLQRLQSALDDRDHAYGELYQQYEQLEETHQAVGEVKSAGESEVQLKAARDQAAAAAAEASSTVAELMSKVAAQEGQTSQLKQENDILLHRATDAERQVEKLGLENQEYRESVTRLQADANALAELQTTALDTEHQVLQAELNESQQTISELNTSLAVAQEKLQQMQQDHAEHTEQLKAQLTEITTSLEVEQNQRETQKLRDQVERQLKEMTQRDVRLEDIVEKLSKARGEVVSLKSEIKEQRATVRVLKRGGDVIQPSTNGQVARRVTPKRSNQTEAFRSSSHIHTDERLDNVYDDRPEHVDDLKKIKGIGPVLEKRLHEIGIYQFSQVKSWTDSMIAEVEEQLRLGGRIARDEWVPQAKRLSV